MQTRAQTANMCSHRRRSAIQKKNEAIKRTKQMMATVDSARRTDLIVTIPEGRHVRIDVRIKDTIKAVFHVCRGVGPTASRGIRVLNELNSKLIRVSN